MDNLQSLPPEPVPAQRPTRLSVWGQWTVALMLLASFVSGVGIWWGQTIQAEALSTPQWLRPALVLHGALNPFQCVLCGFLLCHHIRVGWQMRANLVSGILMEVVFVALILSGIGLYYSPEAWRAGIVWSHRVLGLALPVSLGFHWITALFWVKRVTSAS